MRFFVAGSVARRDVALLIVAHSATTPSAWLRMLGTSLKASAAARFLARLRPRSCSAGAARGPRVLLHPNRAAVGLNPASDFQIMTWSLEWWPWALGHGIRSTAHELAVGTVGLLHALDDDDPRARSPCDPAHTGCRTTGLLQRTDAPRGTAGRGQCLPALSRAYRLLSALAGRRSAVRTFALYAGAHPLAAPQSVFVFPIPLLALFCVRYCAARRAAAALCSSLRCCSSWSSARPSSSLAT